MRPPFLVPALKNGLPLGALALVASLLLSLLGARALAEPATEPAGQPTAPPSVQAPAPQQGAAGRQENEPGTQGDAEIRRLGEQVKQLLPQTSEQRRAMLQQFPDAFALGLLKLHKAELAMASQPAAEESRQLAADSLKEAISIWEALRDGQRPTLAEHGCIERAYISLNDMSPQPYILYVPDSYDGTEPFGLLVFLHGYTPDLNKLNWKELMYSPSLEPLASRARCIVLLPYGRGNTDFQGVGEDDVLRAIKEVKKRYKIDEDRVFLSGISMGGMGALTIGAHYPDQFAALIVIAGRCDYYLWKGSERGSLPAFEARLADGEFGAELLPNYRNLPCVLVHGLNDIVMPIVQSERMYALLTEQGFQATFTKVAGATHWTWDLLFGAPEVARCLEQNRRQTDPRRITFRTYSLKYNRAYWAEVRAIDDWGKPAELSCELNETGTALAVQTTNVAALRVRPPASLTKGGAAVQITWNGTAVTSKPADDGWIELGASEAGASLGAGEAGASLGASEAHAAGLVKAPGLCGPIREAFGGPFVMAFDGAPRGESYSQMLAGAVDWARFAQAAPIMLSADKITPEVMQRGNLVLYGTPETNRLIAQMAAALPIGLGKGQYRVGDRTYDASKYGLSMVYPNPLAPNRLVVINSGVPWGRQLADNHKYDMLPDFIIFTDAKSEDQTDANKFVCAGFFDQHWHLSPASTWYAPEPPGEQTPAAPPEQ